MEIADEIWLNFLIGVVQKRVHLVDLVKSFQTSIDYFVFTIYLHLLAKIGVDTAENEPLEVWGKYSI